MAETMILLDISNNNSNFVATRLRTLPGNLGTVAVVIAR